MYFPPSEVSPSCLYSIMNPFQIRPKESRAHNAFCCSLLIVFAPWKTKWTWNPESSTFFFVLESENESLMGERSRLRTSVASLEFTGRVSVYASVVNWLLSSRQSPTVAGIAAPLLAVVGLYSCRESHTVHLTESMLSPQRWLEAPIKLMMQVFLGSGAGWHFAHWKRRRSRLTGW